MAVTVVILGLSEDDLAKARAKILGSGSLIVRNLTAGTQRNPGGKRNDVFCGMAQHFAKFCQTKKNVGAFATVAGST